MPAITITLVEGYGEDFRRRLTQRLSDTVRMLTGAPADEVTVVINEVNQTDDVHGGANRTPGPAPKPPAEIILAYLAAMELRDLELARTLLAPDFSMTFPGDQRLGSLEALVEWARDRYQSISKTISGVHEIPAEEGTVVYCMGTLSGAWPDGNLFSGIRFIDRFTLRDGKLIDQQVWNDLAEVRAHLSAVV